MKANESTGIWHFRMRQGMMPDTTNKFAQLLLFPVCEILERQRAFCQNVSFHFDFLSWIGTVLTFVRRRPAWLDARTCSARLNPPLTAASNVRPRLLLCRPTRKITWTRSPPSQPGFSWRLWRPLPLLAALGRRSSFNFLRFLTVLPGG